MDIRKFYTDREYEYYLDNWDESGFIGIDEDEITRMLSDFSKIILLEYEMFAHKKNERKVLVPEMGINISMFLCKETMICDYHGDFRITQCQKVNGICSNCEHLKAK